MKRTPPKRRRRHCGRDGQATAATARHADHRAPRPTDRTERASRTCVVAVSRSWPSNKTRSVRGAKKMRAARVRGRPIDFLEGLLRTHRAPEADDARTIAIGRYRSHYAIK